jgi:hypothetical protein
MYHLIVFKDGTKEKCPVEKYTEEQIRKACEEVGREIESITQGELPEAKKEIKPLMFEVRMSYDDTKNLFVTEKELPFVYFAMENNVVMYIAGGAIRGQNIIDVLPDYNAYLGWNRGYKPNSEEYRAVYPLMGMFRDVMLETKKLVKESKGNQEALVSEIKKKQLLLTQPA